MAEDLKEDFSEEALEQSDSGFLELYEIIDGARCMVGVPTKEHQAVAGEIYLQLGNYLKNKTCQAFTHPYALEVKDYLENIPFDSRDIYYYPDVVVICDDFSYKGDKEIPALVVEVASPSTLYNDLNGKLNIYKQMGVKEYWVVINSSHVLVYLLEEGKFSGKIYVTETDVLSIPVVSFPDLTITLDKSKIFRIKRFKK